MTPRRSGRSAAEGRRTSTAISVQENMLALTRPSWNYNKLDRPPGAGTCIEEPEHVLATHTNTIVDSGVHTSDT